MKTKILILLLFLFLTPTITSAGIFGGPDKEQQEMLNDYPKIRDRNQALENRETWLTAGLAIALVGVFVSYAVGFASGVKMRQSFTNEKP